MTSPEERTLARIEQILSDLKQTAGDRTQALRIDTHPEDISGWPSSDTVIARLSLAVGWLGARAARDKSLGADLFSDPAWSILLDLYVSRAAGRDMSISSLSHGANVPLTTGTRWVTMIERAGLVEREGDPCDRRRTLIYLTDKGVARIEDALDSTIDSNRELGIEQVRTADQVHRLLHPNRRK